MFTFSQVAHLKNETIFKRVDILCNLPLKLADEEEVEESEAEEEEKKPEKEPSEDLSCGFIEEQQEEQEKVIEESEMIS